MGHVSQCLWLLAHDPQNRLRLFEPMCLIACPRLTRLSVVKRSQWKPRSRRDLGQIASWNIYPRQGDYEIVVVICMLTTLRKNFRPDLHEVFRVSWQWDNEHNIKFWRRSGSPCGCRDCFTDSSLLGVVDEHKSRSISNRFARWREWYRDTCTMWLGGGMHCPSASSFKRASLPATTNLIRCRRGVQSVFGTSQ